MAMILTSRTPWRRRPSGLVEIDRSSPQANGLIAVYPLTQYDRREIYMSRAVTSTGEPLWSPGVDGHLVLTGNGTTSQVTSFPLDLSSASYRNLYVSFWLRVNVYTTTDLLAMEFTATSNTNNGFYIDPCAAGGNFQVQWYSTTGGGRWVDTFARPSVSDWHQYVMRFDRTARLNVVYVDGVTQSLTAGTHTAVANTSWDNSSLFPLSRNLTTLRINGALTDLRFYAGDTAMEQGALAGELYAPASRWSLYHPLVRRVYFDLGGGGTTDAAGTIAAASTASGIGAAFAAAIGSIASLATAVGVAAAIAASACTAAAAGTAAGVGAATAAADGSAAAVAAASGVGAATAEAAGTAAATGAATGVSEGAIDAVGTAAATSAATGVATGIASSVGTVAATSSATAVTLGDSEAIGTAAALSTATGIGAATATAAGTAAATSSASAVGLDAAIQVLADDTHTWRAAARQTTWTARARQTAWTVSRRDTTWRAR